jgi:hypothetical protein
LINTKCIERLNNSKDEEEGYNTQKKKSNSGFTFDFSPDDQTINNIITNIKKNGSKGEINISDESKLEIKKEELKDSEVIGRFTIKEQNVKEKEEKEKEKEEIEEEEEPLVKKVGNLSRIFSMDTLIHKEEDPSLGNSNEVKQSLGNERMNSIGNSNKRNNFIGKGGMKEIERKNSSEIKGNINEGKGITNTVSLKELFQTPTPTTTPKSQHKKTTSDFGIKNENIKKIENNEFNDKLYSTEPGVVKNNLEDLKLNLTDNDLNNFEKLKYENEVFIKNSINNEILKSDVSETDSQSKLNKQVGRFIITEKLIENEDLFDKKSISLNDLKNDSTFLFNDEFVHSKSSFNQEENFNQENINQENINEEKKEKIKNENKTNIEIVNDSDTDSQSNKNTKENKQVGRFIITEKLIDNEHLLERKSISLLDLKSEDNFNEDNTSKSLNNLNTILENDEEKISPSKEVIVGRFLVTDVEDKKNEIAIENESVKKKRRNSLFDDDFIGSSEILNHEKNVNGEFKYNMNTDEVSLNKIHEKITYLTENSNSQLLLMNNLFQLMINKDKENTSIIRDLEKKIKLLEIENALLKEDFKRIKNNLN